MNLASLKCCEFSTFIYTINSAYFPIYGVQLNQFYPFSSKIYHFSWKCINFHQQWHKLPWPVYHPYSTGLRPDFVPHQCDTASRPICTDGGRFGRRFNADKILHSSTRITPHINTHTDAFVFSAVMHIKSTLQFRNQDEAKNTPLESAFWWICRDVKTRFGAELFWSRYGLVISCWFKNPI